ncbi:hypothetical protein [Chryseobacterium geocarposphaerae]|uniref:Uncharacterized protein n=1 Tax=Chryseobacterium geocarposphaerae TaxID=1416776 RepID=A0A2M9C8W2_9FLAO|nr:hypothetical protein [Chryseobacterium geocarposphaerae]PJJ67224.1 hypothetical protein CLV73_1226 [Chryseobacterium geocarposphaerae]
MELDNFKELWNKEHHDLPEISLEKQNEIHSPLEMIKINMKTEFWLMVVTLPMVFIGFPFTTNDSNVRTISIFVTFLTVGLVVYFYSRFLRIYKMLTKTSTNTNYDLFNIKTQLLVCKEIYISYYISYIPLAFVSSLEQINFQFNEDYHIAIFATSFLIAILLLCVIVKYWIYYMYGKYIEDVVRLVDELNGIELLPRKIKNKTWFEKSQRYFIDKLGVKGNILNTILWFVSVYLLMILVLVIILSIIIIVGAKLDLINLNILLKALNKGN